MTLAGTDVDGDTLTYTLTGDDADLFNVDSSGNVSFKTSPNFKAPGDVGLDNTYNMTLTVTDAAGVTASSALAINILDVKPGGQAIDLVRSFDIVKYDFVCAIGGDGTSRRRQISGHRLLG